MSNLINIIPCLCAAEVLQSDVKEPWEKFKKIQEP